MTKEYYLISLFYADKKAKRSGKFLMNHINEGLTILNTIGATEQTKNAFCLHPLVQADDNLKANCNKLLTIDPYTVILAMEYRNIANQSLSDIVTTDNDGFGDYWQSLTRDIKLSPLKEVNDMLIADKVQNKKDFELYHLGKHERSDELAFYFDCWLEALGISAEKYEELVKLIT